MSPHDDASLRDLAAGYALGGLSAEETRAFEAALARDPSLAAEVAGFREVNALLADAGGALPADAALKARVMARVASEKDRRLPAPAREAGAPGRGLLPWAIAAAAALVVTSALLYRDLGRTRTELLVTRADLSLVRDSLATQAQTLATLLGAGEDLTVVQLTATGTEPPGMRLFWNQRTGRGVLQAYRLPPAEAGRIYQLWLIRDGVPVPSQLFNSGADGAALVANFTLPAGAGVTAAAVTEEPAGGSSQPTSPILLIGTIPTT